jgi:hypothetical protein
VEAALGNVVEVRRLLPQLSIYADVMTVFLASSGLPIADLADSAIGRLRQHRDSAVVDLSLWAAGTWLIERGEAGAVSPLLKELSLLATEQDARRPRLLQASLQARLTLAQGDTAAAIELLNRLLPNAGQQDLRWSPWEALPWERFQLATLLAARGEALKAAQVAAAFDSPASFGYVPGFPRVSSSANDSSGRWVMHPMQMRCAGVFWVSPRDPRAGFSNTELIYGPEVEDGDRRQDDGCSSVPPGKAGPFTDPGLNDLKDYATRMYEWGRAVRRDILVLEYHLKKAGVSPTDFYGDPGDPPPIVE